MNSIQILWAYREAFFYGFLTTVWLVMLASLVGTAIGIALEWLCFRAEGAIRRAIDAVAFGIAAIPALVILFWLYYPAQSILGVSVSPFLTAVVALCLINSMAVYRIAADSVNDLPKQYVSTALVCGPYDRHLALRPRGVAT